MSAAITVVHSLQSVSPAEWNALNRDNSPFLRHEFLVAMERHGAVGERYGWLPRFLIARDADGMLAGAMPLYEKDNSYGELVFDWAWADAYRQHGLAYYPKLVCAVPYTPVTGKRVLTRADDPALEQTLIEAALDYCREKRYSSLHCLFVDDAQRQLMNRLNMPTRRDVQYHWRNRGYTDFESFLATLRAKKRKQIKQERRRVKEKNARVEMLPGDALSETQWRQTHMFYARTFAEKSGYATFNADFWIEIGRTMGEQIIVAIAYLDTQPIACAIYFRDDKKLYGRHWGCRRELSDAVPGLHFDVCYYHGIEYAIKHRLQRFEPGAQGPYKISRGFDPALTYSTHWLRHPDFHRAIEQYVEREGQAVEQYRRELADSTAYRENPPPPRLDECLKSE